MNNNIHPTAVVDRAAKIHAGVQIGAFCVVGPKVELHENVRLVNHVVVDGTTILVSERRPGRPTVLRCENTRPQAPARPRLPLFYSSGTEPRVRVDARRNASFIHRLLHKAG